MRYVAVNQYAATLLGYTRAELLELRVTDVIRTPEAPGEFELMMLNRERAGTTVATRKDGKELDLAYRASETRIAGMPLYVSVCWPV
jgi:PAS domain S-box-containing protein